MTHKENIKAQEDFTDYLNREVLYSAEWSMLGDTGHMKELLKDMTDRFREIYGASELAEDMEFVLVPAVIRVRESGKILAGVVQLDLTSSGEHYGTDFFTKYGVLNPDNKELQPHEQEHLKSLHPYDYFTTVHYPGDIHTDWSKCNDEIFGIIDYCRGDAPEQNGWMTLE